MATTVARGPTRSLPVTRFRAGWRVCSRLNAWAWTWRPTRKFQFFAIHHNGRLVATSLMYLADGLAGIYCVATLADERGKGLGAHVTAEPLRIAQRLGYRVGILQSSAAGHPVYLRLGFADFASVPMFVRMPDLIRSRDPAGIDVSVPPAVLPCAGSGRWGSIGPGD